MSIDADISTTPVPRYARFSRRLRGIVLDWIIAMVILFGGMLMAVSIQSNDFSRVLGIVVVAVLVLYEPILVSVTGGTVGHYFTNLRVVDDRGGNVSFLKACARVLVKGVLGWYSFIILAATRRNQAIHDLVTRSTVQIRDPAKALPGQYVAERNEPAAANMPPRWRRIAVTCVYLVLLAILATVVGLVFLSPGCLNRSFCSAGERFLDLAINVMMLVTMASIIALGWKGRLFGARRA